MLILKKIIFILFLIIVTIAGLQFFGDRDFAQISLAVDKYQQNSDFSRLFSDVSLIIKGGKIKEGSAFYTKFDDKIMYRWRDEAGEVHITEVKPNAVDYDEIRLGDLKLQIQEGLSQEEIDLILNKPKK